MTDLQRHIRAEHITHMLWRNGVEYDKAKQLGALLVDPVVRREVQNLLHPPSQ